MTAISLAYPADITRLGDASGP